MAGSSRQPLTSLFPELQGEPQPALERAPSAKELWDERPRGHEAHLGSPFDLGLEDGQGLDVAYTYHPHFDDTFKLAEEAKRIALSNRRNSVRPPIGNEMDAPQRVERHCVRAGLLNALTLSVGNLASIRFAGHTHIAGKADPEEGLSLFLAVVATVKANVGPAILYLPHALEQGGSVATAVAFPIVFALVTFGGTQMLRSWWRLDEAEGRPGGSYGKIAMRAFGRKGLLTVQFCVASMQSGLVISYFLFVARNVQSVLLRVGVHVDRSPLVITMALAEMPLVLVRRLENISVLALLANVCIAYGIVGIFLFGAGRICTGHSTELPQPVKMDSWPLMVGAVALAFEGNVLVIPIQESVKPSDAKAYPRLYMFANLGIISVFIVFAFVARLALGPSVSPVLPTSLPQEGPVGLFAASVEVIYSVAVICTLPLQMYPATQIFEWCLFRNKDVPVLLTPASNVSPRSPSSAGNPGSPSQFSAPLLERVRSDKSVHDGLDDSDSEDARLSGSPGSDLRGDALRLASISAFAAAALWIGDDFAPFTSLLGAAFGIPCNCVFPSLIRLKLLPANKRTFWTVMPDVVVAVTAMTVTVICTSVALLTWPTSTSRG